MNRLRVYVGWDPRDELAFRACVASLKARASIPLEVVALRDHLLRQRGVYWRSYHVEPTGQMIDARDGRPFSTQFSFARFAIPLIDPRDDWVLFCDADMLWRDDVAKLLVLGEAQPDKALLCVQHDHRPPEASKMDGVAQGGYARKNWSSLMLLRPASCRRSGLTAYVLNNWAGRELHGLRWLPDAAVGALPPPWNWLEGWSAPEIDPCVVHYTRGTPDMLGEALPYAAEWFAALAAWGPEMEATWSLSAREPAA